MGDGPVVAGGVSLDGGVPAMRGVLPIAAAAKHATPAALLFPAANHVEAAIVDGLALYPVRSLFEAAQVLPRDPTRPCVQRWSPPSRSRSPTISPTSQGNCWRVVRSKSPLRVGTISCSADRLAPARRCSRGDSQQFCRRSRRMKRSR
jgi:magnesium chelatase family protein